MLGYIISGDPQKVLASLKKSIQNLRLAQGGLSFGNLQNENSLSTSVSNFNYSFQSDHARIHEGQIITPVHIFHLFFDLTC